MSGEGDPAVKLLRQHLDASKKALELSQERMKEYQDMATMASENHREESNKCRIHTGEVRSLERALSDLNHPSRGSLGGSY